MGRRGRENGRWKQQLGDDKKSIGLIARRPTVDHI